MLRPMDELIAVTGATGAVGGRVAARLAERGVAQRLVVRDPSRAPQLTAAEVRAAPGGFGDADGMRDALVGAHTLLLVPAAEAPDRVQQHITAVDAAAAAGVQRIIYVSFLNASPDATFTLVRHHYATEQRVRATGVPFTFLRMSLYLDFLPSMVGDDGVIRGPAGGGHVAPVLRDDLADVAVAVLTGDGHDGQTYDVTGRDRFTFAEAAATMSRITGRRIAFEDETLEQAYASRAGYGAPDWEVEGWVTSYAAVAAGELDVVTDTVRRLAGHEPVTLAEYVARE
jgi:NAD(P)H dehydrogenase (quinone)